MKANRKDGLAVKRLEKLGINLPETKLRFLEKCLDMDPSKRPDSFKELIVENKI